MKWLLLFLLVGCSSRSEFACPSLGGDLCVVGIEESATRNVYYVPVTAHNSDPQAMRARFEAEEKRLAEAEKKYLPGAGVIRPDWFRDTIPPLDAKMVVKNNIVYWSW